MTWKERLRKLELSKQWDDAIQFMQSVIRDYTDDVDAYICMNYLLMNLLVEEDHDRNKSDYYEMLAKKYFNESYAKFSNSAEYLFFTGTTAVMSEWYFGIDVADYERMLEKAMTLDPDNPLYKRTYYINLDEKIASDKEKMTQYAHITLAKNSPIQQQLETKGAVGEYILGLMTNWSLHLLGNDLYKK